MLILLICILPCLLQRDTGITVKRRLVRGNLILLGKDYVTGGMMFAVVDDVIFVKDLHFILIYKKSRWINAKKFEKLYPTNSFLKQTTTLTLLSV